MRNGSSPPKSFVCPSSEDTPNNEDNPPVFWDFGDNRNNPALTQNQLTLNDTWKQCSYGYQVPFGPVARPSSDRDQRMPLAADKGPWGTFIEGGQGTTAPDASTAAPTWAVVNAASGPDDWRKFNSPNHGGVGDGEGQVILYADSHAEFQTKPLAGVGQDNIYTAWNNANPSLPDVTKGLVVAQAHAAGSSLMPLSQTDTLIYP